jgi:hypothetical protein
MISRRNFLKIAGLSTVAVGAGFTTGKHIGNKKSIYFAVHGFIPADEQIISQLIAGFKNKVRSNADPVVLADPKIGEAITRVDSRLRNKAFSNSGNITYRLKRLDNQIDSDIIISDTENPVYSLNDLSYGFSNIRANIKNKKANYIFSAEYNERDFLSSILNSNKKEVVIENENGPVERISLDKNYRNILIDGPQGKTALKIENGIVRVHKSTCRHEICKHSVAGGVGNIIACAPNKVLVKIELT